MSDFGIRVRVDESGLSADLAGVHSKFVNAAKEIAAITVPVAVIAGIAKTIDKLADLGEEAIKSAGALYDQSRQLGVTAEALQEYRLVASAAGVSSEQFDKALSILNRTVGQAALGQGTFEKTLDSVGIHLRDSEGNIKSVSTVYQELSDKVRDGSLSQAQSIALASAAFGKEGGKMVEVLRTTAEEQQKVIDKAREYGVILSDDLVRRMDEYGDELELIRKGTEALAIQNEALLAPLTVKWAQLKHEIAGVTAELAVAIGLTNEDTQLQMRRLAQTKSRLEYARKFAKEHGVEDPEADSHIKFLKNEVDSLTAQIESARQAAKAALPKPGSADEGGGVNVESAEDYKQRMKALEVEVTATRVEVMQQLPDWQSIINAQLLDQEIETGAERIEVWHTINEAMLADTVEHEGLLTKAHKDGAQQRLDFQRMTTGQQVSTVVDGLVSQTASLAQYNKKAFEVNKAASIAQAVISTAQGIAKGVALGFPLGIPAVAWAAATGAAQIQAIKSTTFQGGGKGTTPSSAGSSPVVNGAPAPATQRLIVEGISAGSLFGGSAVRDLAQRLLDFQRDGGQVLLR